MAFTHSSSLVKFASINTALKILNSQSLRWSAPHLFNDPFELDHTSDTEFSGDQLLKMMIKTAMNVLYSDEEMPSPSNKLVAALLRWREEKRFNTPQEAEFTLKQQLLPIAQSQLLEIRAHLKAWQQFAGDARICCFSNSHENISAWQRFGDEHAGVALTFKASSESGLTKPQHVNYHQQAIAVTSLSEQMEVAFGRITLSSNDDFIELLLHKHQVNSTEQERRCIRLEQTDLDSDPQLWYSNRRFPAGDLQAIYFGVNCSEKDRLSLSALARQQYPATRLYCLNVQTHRYALSCSAI